MIWARVFRELKYLWAGNSSNHVWHLFCLRFGASVCATPTNKLPRISPLRPGDHLQRTSEKRYRIWSNPLQTFISFHPNSIYRWGHGMSRVLLSWIHIHYLGWEAVTSIRRITSLASGKPLSATTVHLRYLHENRIDHPSRGREAWKKRGLEPHLLCKAQYTEP